MTKHNTAALMAVIPGILIGAFGIYCAGTQSEMVPAQSGPPVRQTASQFRDLTSPVIVLEGDDELTLTVGEAYLDPGYTCRDNCDGDLTACVTVDGHVDTASAGRYVLTYRVTDGAGNAEEATRIVSVKNPPDTPVDRTVHGLPILMYHFFYDDTAGEIGRDGNWLKVSDFEEQMRYLSENGFYFPTWEEVSDYVDGVVTLPERSVVVTVDDGNESFFRLAVPVLERLDIPATSFIVTSEVDAAAIEAVTNPDIQFRSHSHDMHRDGGDGKGRFLTMTYADACADLETADQVLGIRQVFCYPYGHYNDFTKQVLADTGFDLALTTEYDRVYPNMDKLALPRVRVNAGESMSSFVAGVSSQASS